MNQDAPILPSSSGAAPSATSATSATTAAGADAVRAQVRERYGQIARDTVRPPACCQPGAGCGPTADAPTAAALLGYRPDDSAAAPEGADLGLGCGNPTAIAALRQGERVLDLGAGAGFDAFLAARQVGPQGRVIGVDMTPDMVDRARQNARAVAASNVEFRLGEIEHLPLADASIDVALSNCVINLSPDKPAVFAEVFRVLAPGGRLAFSDVVTTGPVPSALADDVAALTSCITGAAPLEEVRAMLSAAGFVDVTIEVTARSAEIVNSWRPGLDSFLASTLIQARKPGGDKSCCGPACCA